MIPQQLSARFHGHACPTKPSARVVRTPPPLCAVRRRGSSSSSSSSPPVSELIATTAVSPPPQQQRQQDKRAEEALQYLAAIGVHHPSHLLQQLEDPSLAITVSHIEDACQSLLQLTNLPVTQLASLLQQAPELLTADPKDVAANYTALAKAWPLRQLQRAIVSYPRVLLSSFRPALRRCMATLQGMGFSKAQTAEAVTRYPQLVSQRRYEIIQSLQQCGFPSRIEDPAMFEVLSRHPHLLTPEGSEELKTTLEGIRKAVSITPQQSQYIFARASHIFDQDEASMREIVFLLREFGLSQAQITHMILSRPSILTRSLGKVRLVLEMLNVHRIDAERLINHPKVLFRSATRTVGPRLAFLREFNPSALQLPLSTLLNPEIETFLDERTPGRSVEEFDQFMMSWLVEFQLSGGLVAAGGVGSSSDEDEMGYEDAWEKSFVANFVDNDGRSVVGRGANQGAVQKNAVHKSTTTASSRTTTPTPSTNAATAAANRWKIQQQQQEQRNKAMRAAVAAAKQQKKNPMPSMKAKMTPSTIARPPSSSSLPKAK